MNSLEKIVSHAKSVELINSSLINKRDLDKDINDLSVFWIIAPINDLLKRGGLFSNYWVITKKSNLSSSYELYCGETITSSYVPQIIFVYENDIFQGILIGEVIKKLILIGQNGILSWIKTEPKTYINLGNISPGTRIHRIDHSTGNVTEIPNRLSEPTNISHCQRFDTMAHARQSQMMQAMNTPGISLGTIGANLHLFR
jgi:hypothetical protein